MYERNAIVIERYFNQMFGYDKKNNLKTNFKDYIELVNSLEKYKKISEEEETIMQEYDMIANKIREIQNNQEALNKRNEKYQEERAKIFESLDENAEAIQKKLTNINNNIENINQEINENAQKYVNIVAEFNDKSSIRTTCERNKRKIELEYNNKLNETLDNYQDIDIVYEKKAKTFIEDTTEAIERELKEKIEENGEKEKIPFDNTVIEKAISLSISIYKKETEILTYIYDKTNRLFVDIKNNATKCERYNKIIKDQESKYDFLNAMKNYLIQFLDNERVTSVNGSAEHKKLMKEACKNFDEDFAQISNLYSLLQKEIAKKASKKNYSELYNVDYIKTLTKKAEEFDKEIKKLKISVTVINPNYWRIEGMQKIYDVFNQAVTENYDRDLSEYIEVDEIYEDNNEDNDSDSDEDFDEDFEEASIVEKKENQQNDEIQDINKKQKKQEKVIDTRSEIDKKIDMILGFNEEGQFEDIEEDDDWDDDELEENEKAEQDYENDEYIEDDWDDEDFEENVKEDDDLISSNDDNNEKDDDENDYDDGDWDDEILEEDDVANDEEDDDEDINFDIWGNSISNKKKKDKQKNINNEEDKEELDNKKEESWENEFINIDKKSKNKKKKSFFEKFKK